MVCVCVLCMCEWISCFITLSSCSCQSGLLAVTLLPSIPQLPSCLAVQCPPTSCVIISRFFVLQSCHSDQLLARRPCVSTWHTHTHSPISHSLCSVILFVAVVGLHLIVSCYLLDPISAWSCVTQDESLLRFWLYYIKKKTKIITRLLSLFEYFS